MLQQLTMNCFIPCKDIKLKHVQVTVLFYHPFSLNILNQEIVFRYKYSGSNMELTTHFFGRS